MPPKCDLNNFLAGRKDKAPATKETKLNPDESAGTKLNEDAEHKAQSQILEAEKTLEERKATRKDLED